jgi:hypothetical protein
VTGTEVTGNDVTGTGSERVIISCAFYPYFLRFLPVFPALFAGTPLDSRYEQWKGITGNHP